MRWRVVSVASIALICAGCPDALRGTAGPAPDSGDGLDGGGASSDANGDPDEKSDAPVRAKISDVSGNLALGPSDVFIANDAGIARVPKIGGTTTSIHPSATKSAIVVDAEHLFFVESSQLWSTGLGGESPRLIRNGAGGVTLGIDDHRVYWVSSTGELESAEKRAPSVTVLRDGDSSSQPVFLRLAGPYIAVGVWDPFGKTFQIVRRPKDKAAADVLLGTSKNVLTIVADEAAVYFLEAGSSIRALPLDEAPAPPPIVGPSSRFDCGAMALDAQYVYWVSHREGAVYRASRATGTTEALADGFTFADEPGRYYGYTLDRGMGRLAVDDAYAYVSDESGVYRLRK